MRFVVIGKASASRAITVVLETSAEGAVFNLPVAGIQRFPSRTMMKRIGSGEVIEEPFGRVLALQRWIRHGERANSSRRGFQKRSSLHASTCAGQLRL